MPTTSAVRTDVPVAASTAVGRVLETSAGGTVLACFPAAVYVRLDTGDVLAVVTSDGLRLPNALVVAAATRDEPFARHAPGVRAAVADGSLTVDGVRYRPVRTWTPRSSTAGAVRPDAVSALEVLLQPSPHTGEAAVRLSVGAAALGEALRTGQGVAAASALVGLGPGLTPAGDDLLAGALVTCVQLGRRVPALADAVRRRAHATTALSADLLRHASAGRAAPPVLDLLDALVGRRPVGPALPALLAVGSTSGHDTATGVLVAARALLDEPEPA